MDDFLINMLTTDVEVGESFCREVLSVLLQRNIGKIRVVAQRSISALTPNLRGIRMDVEVEEMDWNETGDSVMNVYDVEPHLQRDIQIARHNRFYQAKIDGRYMNSGESDFSRLPNLYVITIRDYDPFGYDYMVYHVCNKCEEVPELNYDDGLKFMYFYTDGMKGGSEDVRKLLQYMKCSVLENVVDENTRRIHDYVERVKISPEVKTGFMKFEEIIAYERKDAALITKIQDICELLEEYGEIPAELKSRLEAETDVEVLKQWLKLAAKVHSLEEFYEGVALSF